MQSADDQADCSYFTGEAALEQVGLENGLWNWALVGPDPVNLPLSGGGARIEEMRHALSNHAHSFGLVRMTFGVGKKDVDAMTKWLFVHAIDSEGSWPRVKSGKDAAKFPAMQEAICKGSGVSVAATITVNTQEECSTGNLIDKVPKGDNSKLFTLDNFDAAVELWKESHPHKEMFQQDHDDLLEFLEAPEAEVAEAPEPEIDRELSDNSTDSPKQRKQVKAMHVGDLVEVYSVQLKRWFKDGEIIEAVQDACYMDGNRVMAGSVKVVYDKGKRYKWMAPHQMEELLRTSPWPRPPKPMLGMLKKEEFSWFGTGWSAYYVELHKGFLQCWRSKKEAQEGNKPAQSIFLLGLTQEEEKTSGDIIRMRCHGCVHSWKVEVLEAAEAAEIDRMAKLWSEALWAHAGYCEEVCEFYEESVGGLVYGKKELIDTLGERRPESVTERRHTTRSVKLEKD